MASLTFDDPALLTAMRAYVSACDALDAAGAEADQLSGAEAKSMAGLVLRKRLTEAGWTAPAAQRSST